MIEEYVGMPEETLAAFRNLWFHTGDLGTFDEDGYLHFVGRKKDAIRRRGENVSAFEVETVLEDHPAVAEVAVIGVPDDISGEEILALIVPRSAIDPVALLDHCQARLPYYAVPRYVRMVETLPQHLPARREAPAPRRGAHHRRLGPRGPRLPAGPLAAARRSSGRAARPRPRAGGRPPRRGAGAGGRRAPT